MSNFSDYTRPEFLEFEPLGCTFIEDEGYVSYGDSSGTEISSLPWHEAVRVFAVWWRQKKEYNRRLALLHKRQPDRRQAPPPAPPKTPTPRPWR